MKVAKKSRRSQPVNGARASARFTALWRKSSETQEPLEVCGLKRRERRAPPASMTGRLTARASTKVIVGLLMFAVLWAFGATGQTIYHILPVGDSITEGGKTFSNYRYPLWEKLHAAGYLAEFVGSRTSESRIGPLQHEGHGGKNAEFLAGAAEGYFRTNTADIVLIHAGHNHTNIEAPVPGIVAATERMIRTARAANPRVIVLVAQVIPSGKLPKYEYLPALNVELGRLAARLTAPESPVMAVDMAEGFDWRTDAIDDHVHPNARGAEKMAAKWFAALTNVLEAPPERFHPKILTYKKVGDTRLSLHVFAPANRDDGKDHPAIVFFFGGGWSVGTPIQFYSECAHFAARGFMAISADYRIASVNRTTPFESVKDAKSAIRWVREHASELGVDRRHIAAAGASAGGQLAAASAFVPGLDDTNEDLSVSSRPDALVLWYPVVDNGPDGYGPPEMKARYREISPLHNIGTNAPPTLLFLGTNDRCVPPKTAEAFKARVEQGGGECELKLFSGAGHPIYEWRKGASPLRNEALTAADGFLSGLGFVPRM
jgi:acetyl esterase